MFYSQELFEKIVEYTNLSAATKRTADPEYHNGSWTDVTVEEMKAYYGILLLMEVMTFERDELYWYNNEKYWVIGSKIGEIMTRDRYIQIKRYLHFSDDRNNNDDKLHKVRMILDTLRSSFQQEYIPHQHVSVDEAMIPFKGRLGMKQYMKDKPIKFGIKMWVAADAVTAYCHNFEIYVGRNNDVIINRKLGLSSRVVIGMTKPLENKGYVIYTDNFYTSPTLADYLYNTYLCGTVRPSRKGYPKAMIPTARDARRMPRGTSDWLMCGPLLAQYWKDIRLMYYLASYHRPEEDDLVTTRKNKDGTEVEIPVTPTVKGYAAYMAGVDRLDQMSKMNKSKKSLRWYRKIEIRLREIALYNSYILEGTVLDHNPRNKRKRDMLSYRLDVAHQLIGDYRQERRGFKRARSLDAQPEIRLDEKSHWPAGTGSGNTVCVLCNKKHVLYKNSHPGCSVAENPMKRTKTTMKCEKCNVSLCCNARRTCFKDYHTKVYYWQ
ncbi:piggyBac transposable element-derived protein 4-like [Saccostrea echinata]|uniref:piggyBac transposable element-derived protein 4-like n=1 Tax=Saccostrea echinata TaxID=191078 RepID=UPI002A7EC7CD|nr:piggyBac transposable element-derived protein 4-like [Saccostrea echinata]